MSEEIILLLLISLVIFYKIGYHRGEVDKHKEIFDLIDEAIDIGKCRDE